MPKLTKCLAFVLLSLARLVILAGFPLLSLSKANATLLFNRHHERVEKTGSSILAHPTPLFVLTKREEYEHGCRRLLV